MKEPYVTIPCFVRALLSQRRNLHQDAGCGSHPTHPTNFQSGAQCIQQQTWDFFNGSQKRGQTTLTCERNVNMSRVQMMINHCIEWGSSIFGITPNVCAILVNYRYVWIPSAILRCQFSRTAWWARPMFFTVLPQSSALSTRLDLCSYV